MRDAENSTSNEKHTSDLDWKVFSCLMFLALAASFAVVPYLLEIMQATADNTSTWELVPAIVFERVPTWQRGNFVPPNDQPVAFGETGLNESPFVPQCCSFVPNEILPILSLGMFGHPSHNKFTGYWQTVLFLTLGPAESTKNFQKFVSTPDIFRFVCHPSSLR